jgi:hypothetical protein
MRRKAGCWARAEVEGQKQGAEVENSSIEDEDYCTSPTEVEILNGLVTMRVPNSLVVFHTIKTPFYALLEDLTALCTFKMAGLAGNHRLRIF